VRACVAELLPDILRRAHPTRVCLDRTVDLDGVPAGYRAMDDRKALKELRAEPLSFGAFGAIDG
jgi:hypothetical protein